MGGKFFLDLFVWTVTTRERYDSTVEAAINSGVFNRMVKKKKRKDRGKSTWKGEKPFARFSSLEKIITRDKFL